MNNSITIWNDLAIISLNYNSAKEVFRQVSSLREEGIPDVCFYLIDNASNDGKEVEEYCLKNEVKFMANPINGGYAQGNNIGIKKAIEEQGTSIVGEDGEWETPLIDGGECAYVIRDEKGVVLCGIEQAYRDGKISWKKPISCHLYPIRLHKYSSFTAVNYDQWSICKDACVLGKKLQVPVYKFLKEALVRKFGENWYQQLEESKKLLKKYRNEEK